MPDTDPLTTTDLLQAFLSGDPHAREELPRRLHHRLLGLARRLAPDLHARSLHEDAVQRTWELLLSRSRLDYDPHRGSPMAYLATILRNAITDVRAQHAPPGQPTRPNRRASKQTRLTLRRAPDPHRWAGRPADAELVAYTDPHLAAVPERVDALLLLQLARDTAPRPVLLALVMVYVQHAPLATAARALAISPTTLRRRIDAWADAHHLRLIA